jgi:hypothetical protein
MVIEVGAIREIIGRGSDSFIHSFGFLRRSTNEYSCEVRPIDLPLIDTKQYHEA